MRIPLDAIAAQLSGAEWLRTVAAPLHESQLDRDRAGRLLHDQTGQNLTAIGFELSALALDLEFRAPEFAERLRRIQATLDVAMSQVRDISGALNRSVADRTGLRFALGELIEGHRPEWQLDFPDAITVPRAVARALFRVAQPCLDTASELGAKTIRLRIAGEALGWMLEVSYDISSPHNVSELAAGIRYKMLWLWYHATRAGVAVAFEESTDGGSLIRAVYPGNAPG